MHEAPELVLLPPALPETGRLHGLVDQLGDVLLQPDAPKDAQQLARRLKARLPRAGVKVPIVHAAALRRAVANCTDVSALLLHIGELTDTNPDDVARRVLEVTPRVPPPRRRKSAPSDQSRPGDSVPVVKRSKAADSKPAVLRKAEPVPKTEAPAAPAPGTASSEVEQAPKQSDAKTPTRRSTATRRTVVSDTGATTKSATRNARRTVATSTTTSATRPKPRTAATSNASSTRGTRRGVKTDFSAKRATSRSQTRAVDNAKQTNGKPKAAPPSSKAETGSVSASIEPVAAVKEENAEPKIASALDRAPSLQVEALSSRAHSSTNSTVRSLSFRSVSTDNGTQTPGKPVLRARRGRESENSANCSSVPAERKIMAAVSSPITPSSPGPGSRLDLDSTMTPRSNESVRTAVYRIEQIMGVGKKLSVYAREVRNALEPAGFHVSDELLTRLRYETSRCVDLERFIALAARALEKEPIEVALAVSDVIRGKRATTPIARPSVMNARAAQARKSNLPWNQTPKKVPSRRTTEPPQLTKIPDPVQETQEVLEDEEEINETQASQQQVVHQEQQEVEQEVVYQEQQPVQEQVIYQEEEQSVEQQMVYQEQQPVQEDLSYMEEQVQRNEQWGNEQHQFDESEQVEEVADVPQLIEYKQSPQYEQDEGVQYSQQEIEGYSRDGYTQQVEEYVMQNEYAVQESADYTDNSFVQQEGRQYDQNGYVQQQPEEYSEDSYAQQQQHPEQYSQDSYDRKEVEQFPQGAYIELQEKQCPEDDPQGDGEYYEEGYDQPNQGVADEGYVEDNEAEVEPYNPEDDVVQPAGEPLMKRRITPQMAVRDSLELAKFIQSQTQPIRAAHRRIRILENKLLELQVAQRQVNVPTVCLTLGILVYCCIFYLMLYQL